MYLGLSNKQLQVLPFLREGNTYQVYYDQKLYIGSFSPTLILLDIIFRLQRRNPGLLKLEKLDSYKFINTETIFVEKWKGSNQILNVSEASDELRSTKDLISFQGVIFEKKLITKLYGVTEHSQNPVFGTPGNIDAVTCSTYFNVFKFLGTKVHVLIFYDDEKKDKIELFIKFWENLQVPLGLVPDMRVCVRNVKSQYNYCTTTALTSFELLGYEPVVSFDTANLYEASLVVLCFTIHLLFRRSGVPDVHNKCSYLGLGHLIPRDVLIWARIFYITVRTLRIYYDCKGCGQQNLIPNESCHCNTPNRVLKTCMT